MENEQPKEKEKGLRLTKEEMQFVSRGLSMLFKSLKRKADDDTLSSVIAEQYSAEMRDVNALQIKLSR